MFFALRFYSTIKFCVKFWFIHLNAMIVFHIRLAVSVRSFIVCLIKVTQMSFTKRFKSDSAGLGLEKANTEFVKSPVR